ncbi:MAG: hypothetical protein COU10_01110 [Candidatus Harrisonbacteria bacterium CG10_big_fil_rev_8_21_14_0_10_45_28]|uniref:Uncharacterized protein n=1 Tax=Candidatus Harrisonbacteria bacterium CG10_big_fil_rev_8_21_14_0_10_45_28 TaxID=1974586 RepID=A0A2H0UNV4_9BACT|nr:MAG: hypothetical protein COU10_01110 [Candidatus Harrisonbacteria bacterium CG10_big_fil_rev_8_21_14_0_10_45_28]
MQRHPRQPQTRAIKIPHGRAKRYWAELASLALCRLKGQDFEPLLRLRSDEMDNRVTHFASSLVVIIASEPFPRLLQKQLIKTLLPYSLIRREKFKSKKFCF